MSLTTGSRMAPYLITHILTTPQVTVGDVAAQAGVKPSDAEAALQALAADTRGTLEVMLALCTHQHPNLLQGFS